MRTDVYVRRLHYGLVLCRLAVICLDPSGLCSTMGVPTGSMFNDGRGVMRFYMHVGGWRTTSRSNALHLAPVRGRGFAAPSQRHRRRPIVCLIFVVLLHKLVV